MSDKGVQLTENVYELVQSSGTQLDEAMSALVMALLAIIEESVYPSHQDRVVAGLGETVNRLWLLRSKEIARCYQ